VAESPRYVIDASVIGKWHLIDEDHIQQALAVLEDLRRGFIDLVAPVHLRYEVRSLILRAVRARRLSYESALVTASEFELRGVRLIDSPANADTAIQTAMRYGIGYYDSLYIALADELGVRLIHADGRLRRGLGGRFPLELWIEDYLPAGLT
jgi:predicted nucleic acid-binding protein